MTSGDLLHRALPEARCLLGLARQRRFYHRNTRDEDYRPKDKPDFQFTTTVIGADSPVTAPRFSGTRNRCPASVTVKYMKD
jgi:hypothetical protein